MLCYIIDITSSVKDMNLYCVTNNLSAESQQITAIVAVGNLSANQTVKMHITFNLQNGKGRKKMF